MLTTAVAWTLLATVAAGAPAGAEDGGVARTLSGDLVFEQADGTPLDLTHFRGRRLLLVTWASW